MVSLQRTDFSAMLVSLFSRLLCGSTGDDEQSVVSTPREITFPYETFRGSGASHFVRLRLPEESEGCCALVVNIHGGFWKEYWNLSQTLDTSALLAAFPTCATLDVEYSRVEQNEPRVSSDGGGWPHTCLDVLAALNAVATHPDAALARTRLDLRRVYLVGHSAGGQLALWLGCFAAIGRAEGGAAARAHAMVIENIRTHAGDAAAAAAAAGLDRTLHIRGVAAIAPVSDLSEAAAQGLSDYHDATINFMWRVADVEESARAAALDAASPTALYKALPSRGAPPPPPCSVPVAAMARHTADANPKDAAVPSLSQLRVLLVHGSADVDVPAEASVCFAERGWACAHAHPLWLQLIPEADHLEVAPPRHPFLPYVAHPFSSYLRIEFFVFFRLSVCCFRRPRKRRLDGIWPLERSMPLCAKMMRRSHRCAAPRRRRRRPRTPRTALVPDIQSL